MADVPKIPESSEDVAFNASDFGESATLGDVKEKAQTIIPEAAPPSKEGEKPKSWLENKKLALIIAIAGFAVIVVVFGYLFSTLDWELILNPPVTP